jgi:hypothetical protein
MCVRIIFTALSMLAVAQAAELAASRVTVPSGTTTAQAEIRLNTQGDKLAALQADIGVPPGFDVTAAAGAAAAAAEKQITVADLGAGRRRFILAGLNQNAVGDGVVVSLIITIPRSAANQSSITITNASATDPNGRTVNLVTTDGAVSIDTAPAANALVSKGVFAQVASGGSWKTTFFFLNRSTSPVTVKVQFWSDSGGELRLPVVFLQTGTADTTTAFERTIEPSGVLVSETEAPRNEPTIAGWAAIQASGEISAHAVFRQRVQEGKDSEALVPLDAANTSSAILLFDNALGFITGVALANAGNATTIITAVVRDENGMMLAQSPIVLGPGGHAAFVIGDRLPSVRERRGTVEFRRSDGGNVSALGLRFNPFGSFTSIPTSH